MKWIAWAGWLGSLLVAVAAGRAVRTFIDAPLPGEVGAAPARAEVVWESAVSLPESPEALIFEEERRPDFHFSGHFDRGRQAVMAIMLEQANFEYAADYTDLAFSGLDAEGRREALDSILGYRDRDLRVQAFRSLMREWVRDDPEGAFDTAGRVEDPTIRGELVEAVWIHLLREDPLAAADFLDETSAPLDWSRVVEGLSDEIDENYSQYADGVAFILRHGELNSDALLTVFETLSFEKWGSAEETLALWDLAMAQGENVFDRSDYDLVFQSFVAEHLRDDAGFEVVRAWVQAQDDPRIRASGLAAMAEVWMERDPSEAMAATGMLPEGLREEGHAYLFGLLMERWPEEAIPYFDLLPEGDARDHILVGAVDQWIGSLGMQSLLAAADGMQSKVAFQAVLEGAAYTYAVASYRHGWDPESVATEALDPTAILARAHRLPDESDHREMFVAGVYSAWVASGTSLWEDIQADLLANPLISPARKAELSEALRRRSGALSETLKR